MPQLDAWSRRHKALVWQATGSYSADGRPTVDSPEEIRVRWDDTPRVMRGPQGEPIAVDGTAVTGQRLPLHSLLWLAPDQTPGSDTALDQWYDSGSAGQPGLVEVLVDQGGLDLKSRQTRQVVGFNKYKSELPE